MTHVIHDVYQLQENIPLFTITFILITSLDFCHIEEIRHKHHSFTLMRC